MKEYYIYILILDNNPIYVGLSVDVKNRICKHRKTKTFDSYVVLRSFKDKSQALDYEKGIIDFMTFFYKENCLNQTNPFMEMCQIKNI